MSKTLRYQISDWSQITECLSNNSRNLYLSLSNILDGKTLKAQILQVNHTNYGTLFAAMIKGSGIIVSKEDEEGHELPFLTTDQILEQIKKFGFYVTYDMKSNLPMNILSFLATVDNLGYDKITRISLRTKDKDGETYYKPTIILMKSDFNDDLLVFDCIVSDKKFKDKLAANTIMNVTDEPGMQWDWLHYMANISDLLDENIDPTDDFETQTDIETGHLTPYEQSESELTPYQSEEVDEESEDSEEG